MTRKPVPDARHLSVPVAGGVITMRQFSSREYIAMRRGEYQDVDLMEMTVAAIVEYLPGQDPLDLPPDELLGLTAAWIEARKEQAIPPPTA